MTAPTLDRYDRPATFLFDALMTLVALLWLTLGLMELGWSSDTASFVLSLPLVPIVLYYLWFG